MTAVPIQPICTPYQGFLRVALSPARWFWAGMLVMHLAALPAVFTALADSGTQGSRLSTLLRLSGLLTSAALFALKLIDVSWLRIPAGWRARVSLLLIVGVLHVGVFQRAALGKAELSIAPWSAVLALGGVSIAAPTGRRFSEFLLARASFCRAGASRIRSGGVYGRGWLDVLSIPHQLFISTVVSPRAPPVC